MSFLYPFLNFLQPGILWPATAEFRPMLVASAVALLVGLRGRSEYSRASASAHPIFIWLVAFVFVQGLSIYYAGFQAMFEEWFVWLLYPIFVFVSLVLMSSADALRRYVLGMISGGMFIVGFGILAVILKWPEAVEGRAGAYGMYENHNDYSFIIIQILPFVYAYLRAERGLMLRGLLGVSLVACVLGVFMSLSRGAILALILEAVLIVLLGMQGKRRLWLLPVLAVAGSAAVAYQWHARAESQAYYTAEDAENTRFELWRAAKEMIMANPLLGVGSGRFNEFNKFYGEIGHERLAKNTHNTYIEILTGTGFVGFISFALMIYALVRELRRRPLKTGPPWLDATRTATLISLYSILFRAMLDVKMNDWSFYTLCAIGLACAMLQRQIDSSAMTGKGAHVLREADARLPRSTDGATRHG